MKACRGGKNWGVGWSSWWRDLVKSVGCSKRFWEELRRKVRNGESTLFWDDCWLVDGVKLRELFPMLYRLEAVKNCVIADRVCKGGEEM